VLLCVFLVPLAQLNPFQSKYRKHECSTFCLLWWYALIMRMMRSDFQNRSRYVPKSKLLKPDNPVKPRIHPETPVKSHIHWDNPVKTRPDKIVQMYVLVKNRQVVLQIYAPVNVPIKKDVLRGVIVCQSILHWQRILRRRPIRLTPMQGNIVRRLKDLYTSIGSQPCKKNMHLLWRIMHLHSSSIPKASQLAVNGFMRRSIIQTEHFDTRPDSLLSKDMSKCKALTLMRLMRRSES